MGMLESTERTAAPRLPFKSAGERELRTTIDMDSCGPCAPSR
jgi:hypothetical protein